jgi:hypothetical protein
MTDLIRIHPEPFPVGIEEGYCFHGFVESEDVLKDIGCDDKHSKIPPSPPTLREGFAYKKGGTGSRVPRFKGDLGDHGSFDTPQRTFKASFQAKWI